MDESQSQSICGQECHWTGRSYLRWDFCHSSFIVFRNPPGGPVREEGSFHHRIWRKTQKKKMKQGEGDGDISVGDDKDDKDIDFVAITDNAMETDNQETGSSGRDDILHGIKLRH
jgi:hypothetical protein